MSAVDGSRPAYRSSIRGTRGGSCKRSMVLSAASRASESRTRLQAAAPSPRRGAGALRLGEESEDAAQGARRGLGVGDDLRCTFAETARARARQAGAVKPAYIWLDQTVFSTNCSRPRQRAQGREEAGRSSFRAKGPNVRPHHGHGQGTARAGPRCSSTSSTVFLRASAPRPQRRQRGQEPLRRRLEVGVFEMTGVGSSVRTRRRCHRSGARVADRRCVRRRGARGRSSSRCRRWSHRTTATPAHANGSTPTGCRSCSRWREAGGLVMSGDESRQRAAGLTVEERRWIWRSARDASSCATARRPMTALFGEVGLAGRCVGRRTRSSRVREAASLGSPCDPAARQVELTTAGGLQWFGRERRRTDGRALR